MIGRQTLHPQCYILIHLFIGISKQQFQTQM